MSYIQIIFLLIFINRDSDVTSWGWLHIMTSAVLADDFLILQFDLLCLNVHAIIVYMNIFLLIGLLYSVISH